MTTPIDIYTAYRLVRRNSIDGALTRMYREASYILSLLEEEKPELQVNDTFDALYPESLPSWDELTAALHGFASDYERLG